MNNSSAPRLGEKQKKRLRSLGHALKPVILIGGKGVTEQLIAECDRALEHHELLKIKARGLDRNARPAVFRAICDATGAILIQSVGMTALIYRPNATQPRIEL